MHLTNQGTSKIVGGPNFVNSCHFPFEYKNETYYQCIIKDSPHQKPWCSSTPKFSDKSFGYCDCTINGKYQK